MPELPEVETIVRELDRKVSGKIVKTVEIRAPKLVLPSVAIFVKKLKGEKIKKFSRRAKMIIAYLSSGNFLLVHLKMTGQLIHERSSGKIAAVGGHPQKNGLVDLPNKFTHIILTFTDGSRLFYNDIRKFGWMKIVDQSQLEMISGKHGIEPFTKEFTLVNFQKVFSRYPNRKVKQLLLDQSLIAGVGNIYADESCFCAGILPTRIVKKIKSQELKKLFGCISRIMKLAISKGGTSADTYVRTDGSQGGFLPYLKVYGRAAQKCKRCGGVIKKIKLNGRGTHYCDGCQK